MIDHNKPWILPDDIAAVSAALQTNWLAPGQQVAALEQEFLAFYGGGQCCTVSSGSAALFVALKAANLKPGDRVVLPTYVCTAVLNAIILSGASPVLADIQGDTFNIDPESVEALRCEPRAVIAVHTYGVAADVQALSRCAEIVIEDCSQSLGGCTASGDPLGKSGAAAIFSFYASKVITGGHGGMVYSANTDIGVQARDYVSFDGRDDWKPRFNFQITDFQAALVRSQFARLATVVSRRRNLAARYRAVLPAGYRVQAGLDLTTAMPYRFVISAPNSSARDRLQRYLFDSGIRTIVPLERKELLHRFLKLSSASFPNAERVAETTLSIPLYPALTGREEDRVVDALSNVPLP